MSFIEGVKGFIEASRVGGLIALIVQGIRGKLDKNGDGEVDVAEVLHAIPTDLLFKFGGETIAQILPALITIVQVLQKELGAKEPKV
jgi:hypothetical protein